MIEICEHETRFSVMRIDQTLTVVTSVRVDEPIGLLAVRSKQ